VTSAYAQHEGHRCAVAPACRTLSWATLECLQGGAENPPRASSTVWNTSRCPADMPTRHLRAPDAVAMLDARDVVRVGTQVVDEVRPRAQQDAFGRRGHKHEPLYRSAGHSATAWNASLRGSGLRSAAASTPATRAKKSTSRRSATSSVIGPSSEAQIGKRILSENDKLIWPHCAGLIWPHPGSISWCWQLLSCCGCWRAGSCWCRFG
jgi:hypothetical protein